MIILLIQWLCIHMCCYCLGSDTTYCRNGFVPEIYFMWMPLFFLC